MKSIPELEIDINGQFWCKEKTVPSHLAMVIETARLVQINERIADTLSDLFELLETTIQELKISPKDFQDIPFNPEPREDKTPDE